MAISVGRADQHVAQWGPRLNRFQSTTDWGRSLYHACQVEVAAEILRGGEVICRNLVPALLCDVANQGALNNNPAAHDYVRLYFRPKNRFHLKTEGIKSKNDPHRVDPHMCIPIMLIFDLKSILTKPESRFVAGNFANSNQVIGTGDAQFDRLNFEQIYHDSAVSQETMQEIHNMRMSEVVIPQRLDLGTLTHVVSRTIHEERHLKRLLGIGSWNYNFTVEKGGSIFFRRGIFISELYTQNGELHFDFSSPTSSPKPQYEVAITCQGTRAEYALAPKRWRIPAIVNFNPNAVWKIEIEGCVAYEGTVPPAGPVVA
ncbi:MAG: DUF4433 domain-containing protein [Mesorhizobium sp.]|nr:MAG: DUF4433 domain-containing protein [Mesorhizobium sp.]